MCVVSRLSFSLLMILYFYMNNKKLTSNPKVTGRKSGTNKAAALKDRRPHLCYSSAIAATSQAGLLPLQCTIYLFKIDQRHTPAAGHGRRARNLSNRERDFAQCAALQSTKAAPKKHGQGQLAFERLSPESARRPLAGGQSKCANRK